MGALTPAQAFLSSGLIGAGSSLTSGLLSSSSAAKNNRTALDFQKWSQLQAQQWQEQMYSQQMMDQENFYKKYQSPEAIAAQLSKLGVNPAQVFSGGSGVGTSPASMPSGMSSPALSAPSLENEGTALASSLQAVGNAMSSIASAGHQTEQSEEMLHTFSSRMTQLLLQNGNTRLANAKAQWDLFAEQNKLPLELQNMVLDSYGKFVQGQYTESLTRLNDITEYIKNNTKDLEIDQVQQALNLIYRQIGIATEQENLVKAQVITEGERAKTEKSAQVANYASAALSDAQTASEKTRKSILDFDAIIRGNDAKISSVTLNSKINTIKSELKKDRQLSEATRAAAYIELQKLNRIIKMYEKHPDKLRLDATLKNFNENFPVLSQIGSLAKGI